MTKRQNRDSYLSEETILGRVVDTCDKISQFLAELRQQTTDERTQLHLDKLIELQNTLTGEIAEYRETAPWQVSNTYVQYVDPGSGRIDDMIRDHGKLKSLNDATDTAIALNNELIQELQHVSINEGVPESRDAFNNLQELIESTCKKMSMDRSMTGDI